MIENKIEEIGYTPPETKDVRWMFDYDFFLLNVRAKLRGEIIEQVGTKLKTIQISKPLLNDDGVEQTIALLNGFVDKIHALSIMNEERVLDLCKDLCINLSKFYYVNMEKFDLDPSRASVIIRLIMNLFETNLRKSIGAQSLRIIGQSERFVVSSKDEEKKKFGII